MAVDIAVGCKVLIEVSTLHQNEHLAEKAPPSSRRSSTASYDAVPSPEECQTPPKGANKIVGTLRPDLAPFGSVPKPPTRARNEATGANAPPASKDDWPELPAHLRRNPPALGPPGDTLDDFN
jgi:hypothetical protein